MHFLAIVIAIILIGIFWPIFVGMFMLALLAVVAIVGGIYLYHNGADVFPYLFWGIIIVWGLTKITLSETKPVEPSKPVEPPKPKSKTRVDPTFDDDVVREFDLELKRRNDGTYT